MENRKFEFLLIESAIKVLKEVGKSDDISTLLALIDTNETGLLQDFFIELSLAANPQEEVGAGCYSLEHIERAFAEFKEKGNTHLFEVLKE